MKNLLLTTVLLLAFATVSHAQEPPTVDIAHYIVRTLDFDGNPQNEYYRLRDLHRFFVQFDAATGGCVVRGDSLGNTSSPIVAYFNVADSAACAAILEPLLVEVGYLIAN